MREQSALPDSNRLSVLTAAVLLALALTSLIKIPQTALKFQVLGVYVSLNLNLRLLTTLLAGGLTATGMDWLLRQHPGLGGRSTLEHWLLPTLTTLVVGVPLYILPAGGIWWLAFGVGGILLVLVFLAEYAAVEPTDSLYSASSAGLIALSFALFLILTVALHYAAARLFLLVPIIFLASALVSLRALHLRLRGSWEVSWATSIALVCTQFAAGLHYWPLTSTQFGLFLLGPLYVLINLATSLKESVPLRRALVEPAIILGVLWGLAALMG